MTPAEARALLAERRGINCQGSVTLTAAEVIGMEVALREAERAAFWRRHAEELDERLAKINLLLMGAWEP